MLILKIVLYLITLALFHSLQETQIEGKDGWARKLPTFRIDSILTRLFIGKPVTGYHLFMLIMFIIIFHGTFLFLPWSLKTECLTLAAFIFYFILEDFLFFVVNKHYKLQSFKPGRIPWHVRWAFYLPVSYWIGIILGVLFIIIGTFI